MISAIIYAAFDRALFIFIIDSATARAAAAFFAAAIFLSRHYFDAAFL